MKQRKGWKPGRQFCGLHSLGGRLDGEGASKYRVSREVPPPMRLPPPAVDARLHWSLAWCKSWTCPQCAAKRARRLKKAIIREAEAHNRRFKLVKCLKFRLKT